MQTCSYYIIYVRFSHSDADAALALLKCSTHQVSPCNSMMVTDSQNTFPAQTLHYQQFYYPRGSHIFCVSVGIVMILTVEIFFQVENMLYKLYGKFLSSHSGLFKDLFVVCDPTDSTSSNATEGLDDEHSIILEGEHSDVFDLFLIHVHGK